jgi:hypothetical protein
VAPTVEPTIAPVATPAPTATAAAISGTWQQVPTSPELEAVEFSDVTWTGSRFVAIGRSELGGTFVDSTDGIDWSIQVPAGGKWTPDRIASGPDGVVAIGFIGDHFASFTSTDGERWLAHEDGFPMPSLGTDVVELTDIVATGDGWIVVGRRDEICMIDCGMTFKRAYVWNSSDGVAWTRVADQASLKGGGMNAITQAGAGYVAAGVANGHAAIWTSPDGLVWQRVPDDPMFGPPGGATGPLTPDTEPPIAAVGAAERLDAYVVVGDSYAQDSCDPATADSACPGIRAWWSTDGITWTKATVAGARNGQVSTVTTVADGFVALGFSAGCTSSLLGSADGRAWSCTSGDVAFNGFGADAAATSPGVDVLVGSSFTDEETPPVGAIWYRVSR